MTRIMFFFDDYDNIVLLHGFIKKQTKTTNTALETARARRLALVGREAYIAKR